MIERYAKTNCALTQRVTELHGRGYDHDFTLSNDQRLFCVQTNASHFAENTSVILVDQVYDNFYSQFIYIYSVESDTGEKGIMLLNYIAFDAIAI